MQLDQSLVFQILERQKCASTEIKEMGKQVPNHLLKSAEVRLEMFITFKRKAEEHMTGLQGKLDELAALFRDETAAFGRESVLTHSISEYLVCFDFSAQSNRIKQLLDRDHTAMKNGIDKAKASMSSINDELEAFMAE